MHICLNGGTAAGGTPAETFTQIAADAGFQGADVDVHYGVKHGAGALHDLFHSKNLKFGCWGAPDWRSDETKWRDGLEGFRAAAKVAGALRIDSCGTWIMPSSDRAFMENWNFHVTRLKPVADILRDNGLRLGLEFVAPFHLRRMSKHEFIFTPGAMLELADAVGPNVGLLVDCFHVHAASDTWEHLTQIPASKIVLAHLNDCPKVPIPDIKDGERLLPGEGAIDTVAYLKALQAAGYDGPVSLEVFNADLRKLSPADAAKRAWSATSKVAQAAGLVTPA